MALSAKQIDDCIDNLYGQGTGGGELRQLAKLFSPTFWKDFETLLQTNFVRTQGVFKQEVDVGLGYIDKIPLALMHGAVDAHGQPITQKTEIGDAVFFFVDTHYDTAGRQIARRSRALILQAKQASSAALPKTVPIVPLPQTQNNSTLKELALLSSWPVFDLYFASASKQPLQKGYDLDSTGAKAPKAWYIGASPKTQTPWSPRWIAGPSDLNAACNESLGSILHAVLDNGGRINNAETVGCPFTYDETRLRSLDAKLATTSNPPDWNDLCHQLILSCNSIDLPHHLFGAHAGRRKLGVQFHSNPFDVVIAAIWRAMMGIGRWLGIEKCRRFPVVIVERRSGEGKIPRTR